MTDTIRNRLSLFRFTAVHRSCPVPNRPCLTDLPNPNYQLIPINILSYNLSFPNLKPVLLFILICYIQSYIIYSILSYLLSYPVLYILAYPSSLISHRILFLPIFLYPILCYITLYPFHPILLLILVYIVWFFLPIIVPVSHISYKIQGFIYSYIYSTDLHNESML